MVCHSEYCLYKGEKNLREMLIDLCLGCPIFIACWSLLYRDNLRNYLVCNGREEILFQLEERFLENGVEILLPAYHPFRITALMIGMRHVLLINPLGFRKVYLFY